MEPGPELTETRPASGPRDFTGTGSDKHTSSAAAVPPGLPVPVDPSGALPATGTIERPGWARRLLAGHGRRLVELAMPLRFAFLVYAASRLLLIVVGIVGGALQGWTLTSELSNWDGVWYLQLAAHGYPAHVSHLQTTLGFFPLYPLSMWLVAHLLACSYVIAGLVVSGVSGLVATVLVQRVTARWWGEVASRRAVVAFCLFPGSVVFSMVYSEGLLLALVAGCLLALEDRRWLLAGLLAGAATAIGPDALAIVPACAVASFLEIRRQGWADRSARRSLAALFLAPVGIAGVGAYLWARTGTPLATFEAQRYGWGERTDALALYRQARRLANEISFSPFSYHAINLNYVVGSLGALFLLATLVLLFTGPRRIPVPALAWTLGIAFFCVTSEYTPPNPRLLITAFPVVVVMAHRLGKKGFARYVGLSTILLVAMSAVTYVGIALRP